MSQHSDTKESAQNNKWKLISIISPKSYQKSWNTNIPIERFRKFWVSKPDKNKVFKWKRIPLQKNEIEFQRQILKPSKFKIRYDYKDFDKQWKLLKKDLKKHKIFLYLTSYTNGRYLDFHDQEITEYLKKDSKSDSISNVWINGYHIYEAFSIKGIINLQYWFKNKKDAELFYSTLDKYFKFIKPKNKTKNIVLKLKKK